MAAIVGWITESVREILQISGLTLQSFLVFCTAFTLACFLLKPRRNLPPYPAGRVPVIGHLLALGRAPHLKLTAWRRQYGDVFTVRMGMEDVVILNGYTAVKDALVDRSELFASRPQNYMFDAILGFGKDIASARWGPEFRQRKRFATAVLKNLGMKGGTGSIEEKIREEASCLRNRCGVVIRASALKQGDPGSITRCALGKAASPSLIEARTLSVTKLSSSSLQASQPEPGRIPRYGPPGEDGCPECMGLRLATCYPSEGHRVNPPHSEYNGNPADIAHDVTVAVANVVCSIVMGKRYDYQDETFRELAEAVVTGAMEVGAGQIIGVFPLLRFVPFVNRSCNNALKENIKIQTVLRQETSRHRENLDRENPRDFLDFCLLEVEKQEKVESLTEENVLYMAQNLFMAGIETTTNTLMWSLLFMTLNPDIQRKVQQELDAVVGEGLPALSHRSQLPYVNACLLEVMRIRPVAPLSAPHATTETVEVQEYVIPKGTQILPNLYSLHMDPAYWPDPDRFDPGRFLDVEGNVTNKPESFIPFGGGRRGCIGEQLARMELFLFFSALLQSFTFMTPEGAPTPNTDGVLGITWRPHPFNISAIPLSSDSLPHDVYGRYGRGDFDFTVKEAEK
ncbi:cytochrome P450 2 sub U member 1 [Branchiostoma belcheri]|nr:cytochrome P450 2 sub U member 1 [Branchiostoma belcheri]